MSITNTTKENLKDEHGKHHQRWWCLPCSSFKFSLEVLVMLISLAFFGGVCYAHLLSSLWWCLLCPKENLKDEHNKHHQRKLKR
jgi:polyferredoxin